MLKLDHASIEAFFINQQPGLFRHVARDPDPDDVPSVLTSLIRLGRTLDRALAADPAQLSTTLATPQVRDALRLVLAHCGTLRRVRLLHWLATAPIPDRHQILRDLLADSGNDDPQADAGRIVRESAIRLHRSEMMRCLFAPERIACLLDPEDTACAA